MRYRKCVMTQHKSWVGGRGNTFYNKEEKNENKNNKREFMWCTTMEIKRDRERETEQRENNSVLAHILNWPFRALCRISIYDF